MMYPRYIGSNFSLVKTHNVLNCTCPHSTNVQLLKSSCQQTICSKIGNQFLFHAIKIEKYENYMTQICNYGYVSLYAGASSIVCRVCISQKEEIHLILLYTRTAMPCTRTTGSDFSLHLDGAKISQIVQMRKALLTQALPSDTAIPILRGFDHICAYHQQISATVGHTLHFVRGLLSAISLH